MAMRTWDEAIEGVVSLPDGRRVRGRGLYEGMPPAELVPDFGLYLTGEPHREPGWESRWVRWPDFGLPDSTADAVDALREAFERARDARIEIACDGGTGRTGSAIALLARLGGVPPREAVGWVRANYRPKAVETWRQRRWVARTQL